MLPSELLNYTHRAGRAYPKLLEASGERLERASAVLEVIRNHRSRTRGELDEAMLALEGDAPDYRLVRGLAHLALNEAEFEIESPLEPSILRRVAFTMAAERGYGEREAQETIEALAARENLEPALLRQALYADLPENQYLKILPELSPTALIHRYNLAQTQGLLYYATNMVLQAHRNEVGEYKKLFRFLKFYGLMYAVEGDLDLGYRISVDGPASLFSQTRKYGLQMAAFLPALLHVTKWELSAELRIQGKPTQFTLTSQSGLVSHYKKPPEFDSLLEQGFAERWKKLETPWRLEREVEIVDLKGTVFLPDFALRHPSDRTGYLEIVGFWRADYLQRKFEKIRRAGMSNLIVAVSERLNVGTEKLEGVTGPVIFFKGKLEPRKVLELVEKVA